MVEKNMSFKIDDDEVYVKYNSIWNKIKELLGGIKLGSDVIDDDQYIKTKLKTFSEVIRTLFDDGEIPKERIEYICISCIGVCLKSRQKVVSTSLFRTVQI